MFFFTKTTSKEKIFRSSPSHARESLEIMIEKIVKGRMFMFRLRNKIIYCIFFDKISFWRHIMPLPTTVIMTKTLHSKEIE